MNKRTSIILNKDGKRTTYSSLSVCVSVNEGLATSQAIYAFFKRAKAKEIEWPVFERDGYTVQRVPFINTKTVSVPVPLIKSRRAEESLRGIIDSESGAPLHPDEHREWIEKYQVKMDEEE